MANIYNPESPSPASDDSCEASNKQVTEEEKPSDTLVNEHRTKGNIEATHLMPNNKKSDQQFLAKSKYSFKITTKARKLLPKTGLLMLHRKNKANSETKCDAETDVSQVASAVNGVDESIESFGAVDESDSDDLHSEKKHLNVEEHEQKSPLIEQHEIIDSRKTESTKVETPARSKGTSSKLSDCDEVSDISSHDKASDRCSPCGSVEEKEDNVDLELKLGSESSDCDPNKLENSSNAGTYTDDSTNSEGEESEKNVSKSARSVKSVVVKVTSPQKVELSPEKSPPLSSRRRSSRIQTRMKQRNEKVADLEPSSTVSVNNDSSRNEESFKSVTSHDDNRKESVRRSSKRVSEMVTLKTDSGDCKGENQDKSRRRSDGQNEESRKESDVNLERSSSARRRCRKYSVDSPSKLDADCESPTTSGVCEHGSNADSYQNQRTCFRGKTSSEDGYKAELNETKFDDLSLSTRMCESIQKSDDKVREKHHSECRSSSRRKSRNNSQTDSSNNSQSEQSNYSRSRRKVSELISDSPNRIHHPELTTEVSEADILRDAGYSRRRSKRTRGKSETDFDLTLQVDSSMVSRQADSSNNRAESRKMENVSRLSERSKTKIASYSEIKQKKFEYSVTSDITAGNSDNKRSTNYKEAKNLAVVENRVGKNRVERNSVSVTSRPTEIGRKIVDYDTESDSSTSASYPNKCSKDSGEASSSHFVDVRKPDKLLETSAKSIHSASNDLEKSEDECKKLGDECSEMTTVSDTVTSTRDLSSPHTHSSEIEEKLSNECISIKSSKIISENMNKFDAISQTSKNETSSRPSSTVSDDIDKSEHKSGKVTEDLPLLDESKNKSECGLEELSDKCALSKISGENYQNVDVSEEELLPLSSRNQSSTVSGVLIDNSSEYKNNSSKLEGDSEKLVCECNTLSSSSDVETCENDLEKSGVDCASAKSSCAEDNLEQRGKTFENLADDELSAVTLENLEKSEEKFNKPEDLLESVDDCTSVKDVCTISGNLKNCEVNLEKSTEDCMPSKSEHINKSENTLQISSDEFSSKVSSEPSDDLKQINVDSGKTTDEFASLKLSSTEVDEFNKTEVDSQCITSECTSVGEVSDISGNICKDYLLSSNNEATPVKLKVDEGKEGEINETSTVNTDNIDENNTCISIIDPSDMVSSSKNSGSETSDNLMKNIDEGEMDLMNDENNTGISIIGPSDTVLSSKNSGNESSDNLMKNIDEGEMDPMKTDTSRKTSGSEAENVQPSKETLPTKRGRPRSKRNGVNESSNDTVPKQKINDTAGDNGEVKKRSRGRPRKNKPSVFESSTEIPEKSDEGNEDSLANKDDEKIPKKAELKESNDDSNHSTDDGKCITRRWSLRKRKNEQQPKDVKKSKTTSTMSTDYKSDENVEKQNVDDAVGSKTGSYDCLVNPEDFSDVNANLELQLEATTTKDKSKHDAVNNETISAESENVKPEKVKSRWRRSSELENLTTCSTKKDPCVPENYSFEVVPVMLDSDNKESISYLSYESVPSSSSNKVDSTSMDRKLSSPSCSELEGKIGTQEPEISTNTDVDDSCASEDTEFVEDDETVLKDVESIVTDEASAESPRETNSAELIDKQDDPDNEVSLQHIDESRIVSEIQQEDFVSCDDGESKVDSTVMPVVEDEPEKEEMPEQHTHDDDPEANDHIKCETADENIDREVIQHVSKDKVEDAPTIKDGKPPIIETSVTEVLPKFEHLDENRPLSERSKRPRGKREVRRMQCDCIFSIEDELFTEVACGDDCLNRLLMIECGSRCSAGKYCSNKRFQKREYAKVIPFKTKLKGWGLMTDEDLHSGEFVMEYVGEILNSREFQKRVKQYSKEKIEHYYFMSLRADEILDATRSGNVSRFINHSCFPNIETQKWTVNGDIRIGFFTNRAISRGEELTFDYQFQRYGREAQKCLCESENCRGYIGGEKQVSYKTNKVLCKKKKTAEEKKRELFEDMALEEEVEKLSSQGGLKNRNDTITLCRLMVRAEDLHCRKQLLKLLRNTTEQACLRLFLDYHGLSLMWSWMADIGHGSIELKAQILETLVILPIPNKTTLEDSKVLDVVKRWAVQIADSTKDSKESEHSTDGDASSSELSSSLQSPREPPAKKLKSSANEKEQNLATSTNFMLLTDIPLPLSPSNDVNATKDHSSDENTNGYSIGKQMDGTSSMPSTNSSILNDTNSTPLASESEKKMAVVDSSSDANGRFMSSDSLQVESCAETKSDDEASEQVNKYDSVQVSNLATKLLDNWSNLKEIFRIPKREFDPSEESEKEIEDKKVVESSPDSSSSRGRSTPLALLTPPNKIGKRLKKIKSVPENIINKHERRKRFALEMKQKEENEAVRRQEEIERQEAEREQHQAELIFAAAAAMCNDPSYQQDVYSQFTPQEQLYPSSTIPPPDVGSIPVLPLPHPAESADGLYGVNANIVIPSRQALLPTPDPYSVVAPPPNQQPPIPTVAPMAPQAPQLQPMLPSPFPSVSTMPLPPPRFVTSLPQPTLLPPQPASHHAMLPPQTVTHRAILPTQPTAHQAMLPPQPVAHQAMLPPQATVHQSMLHQPATAQLPQQQYVTTMSQGQQYVTHAHHAPTPVYYIQHPGSQPTPVVIMSEPEIPKEVAPPPPSPPKAKKVKLPPNWKMATDTEGNTYYYHSVTRKTQWEPPAWEQPEEMMEPSFPVEKHRHSRKKSSSTTTAAADTSSELVKKTKELFRAKMSSFIVHCLNPFRKPDCKIGRITCTEDFKHLARKLTHFVMAKELKHCHNVEDLECNDNVKHKAKDFVCKYLTKYGLVYKKNKGSPSFNY